MFFLTFRRPLTSLFLLGLHSFFSLPTHHLKQTQLRSGNGNPEQGVGWRCVFCGGPQAIEVAPRTPGSLHPVVPYKGASRPCSLHSPEAQGRGGIYCAGMACCYGNQRSGNSAKIHSGEPGCLGGGEEAKLRLGLCPPITHPVMLGKSLNLSEPSFPSPAWEQQPPLAVDNPSLL